MKRILVIDESEVVRETLALILGREFAVVERPLTAPELPLVEPRDNVHLLIFGVTPRWGSDIAGLSRFAESLPFAALFLVDSKSSARTIESRAKLPCLTKPFNPYELREKVRQLLVQPAKAQAAMPLVPGSAARDLSSYLEYPYLSRSAALLAERFAGVSLPLLISGEIGSGQERVLAGICSLSGSGRRLSINAAELSEEYLERKRSRMAHHPERETQPTALVVENLDRVSPGCQSMLLDFFEEADGRLGPVRYLASANADLLERVYRGEFLEALYYKLATLTLKLSPLRERAGEIPLLADWFARRFAQKLDLIQPSFSSEAKRRLSNYLWFGNVHEMEAVIARTIAFHRKPDIEETDLIFDFGPDPEPTAVREFSGVAQLQASPGEPKFEIYGEGASSGSTNGRSDSGDLNVVIHELAHEFKNPMVTIKTFAQLLGERYQDENFRSRFQDVVENDIARMDGLLEVMLEFADFAKPRLSRVVLSEKLRDVLREVQAESAKRQIRFLWKGQVDAGTIDTDEAQLAYILKNVLSVALSEARAGSEIEIDVSAPALLAIRYPREGARVTSISHYVDGQSGRLNEGFLPLRVLLAKRLLERNGGCFTIEPTNEERETLRLEFSLAHRQHES